MKASWKLYKCKKCGHEKRIQTDHYGECYGYMDSNMCHICGSEEQQNCTWLCQEKPPEGEKIPAS